MPLCAQNALHSCRRLLTPARERCRSCCPRCIFHTAVRCLSKCSAARQPFRFLRPAVVIDRVRCRFRTRKCTAFIQAASHARPQAMPPCCLRCIFRASVHCLLIILRNGKQSAFCVPPLSLTAEDVASVRGILCIHAGGFSLSPAHKRCCFRCLRYIFHTAVCCIQNVLRARQPFRFSRSTAFVIAA